MPEERAASVQPPTELDAGDLNQRSSRIYGKACLTPTERTSQGMPTLHSQSRSRSLISSLVPPTVQMQSSLSDNRLVLSLIDRVCKHVPADREPNHQL